MNLKVVIVHFRKFHMEEFLLDSLLISLQDGHYEDSTECCKKELES